MYLTTTITNWRGVLTLQRYLIFTALCIGFPLYSESEYIKVFVKTTAYCPCEKCCGTSSPGKTAAGNSTNIVPWNIAADPSILPYGTKIIVPGYKPSVGYLDTHLWRVDDTGAELKRSTSTCIHLDLRYIHHSSAIRYGVKYIFVFICTDTMSDAQINKLKALHTNLINQRSK